jgi:MFS superfamily sulfate permease-like transporter
LTSNGNSPMSSIFAACFLLCALVFLGSIVWIVVKAVRESSGGGA